MKVNILGEEYEIIKCKNNERLEANNAVGLCECYLKQILLDDFEENEKTYLNIKKYKDKVLRHEMIHAFIHESGLDVENFWAKNEEMVDYFALQIPKMVKAMKEAGCLE